MHQFELNRVKAFNKRIVLLGGLKLMLLSLVGGQLYNLQILQREKYRTKADENRINIRVLPPPRGRIFDRSGRILADFITLNQRRISAISDIPTSR